LAKISGKSDRQGVVEAVYQQIAGKNRQRTTKTALNMPPLKIPCFKVYS